ncbi:MAG TPA: serine hydrolase domain-containing protein, partial [Anaerolineae bacterium]
MEFSQLESFIFEKIGESKLPGVAAALVQDNQVIWTKGFGFRDIERGLGATPHSLYGIGSITKSFTALAIMQLVERSLLSLDDPVEKYIPFPVKPHGELVRIWHLLTHTSGIPALAYAEAVIRGATGAGQTWLPISGYSDMLTFLRDANEWVLDKPGARWFYLNEGYILLGMIIEVCSGVKYAEYISKYIFEPLGMNRSFFEKQDVERDPDNATPYVVTDDGQRRPSTY